MVKTRIENIRAMPDKAPYGKEFLLSLGPLALGAALGILAKASDSVSVLGHIGTNLGVWIFTAALIAAYSRTPLFAAIRMPVFFLSMLAGYYGYGQLALGFFPRSYFLGWLTLSLVSPIGGLVCWFARGGGWPASLAVSFPISILLAEGYPALYTRDFSTGIDLVFALILIMALPKTWKQRLLALAFSCALSVLIVRLSLFSYLPH